ncbi:RDD family protein [Streptomyces sp. G44]|nr:RDD family protein [Streptomyces sp. G44]
MDCLINFGPFWLLACVQTVLFDGQDAGEGETTFGAFLVLLGFAVMIIMCVVQAIREGRTGQTVGKKAVGIRVIRAYDGLPPGGPWPSPAGSTSSSTTRCSASAGYGRAGTTRPRRSPTKSPALSSSVPTPSPCRLTRRVDRSPDAGGPPHANLPAAAHSSWAATARSAGLCFAAQAAGAWVAFCGDGALSVPGATIAP